MLNSNITIDVKSKEKLVINNDSNYLLNKEMNSDELKSKIVNNKPDNEQFCKCNVVTVMYSDTDSSDFGYWDVCGVCNKKIEDGFHYYNHYDGEDHDDIDLYC